MNMNTPRRTSQSPLSRAVTYASAFLAIILVWGMLALIGFRGSPIFPGPMQVFLALATEMSWAALLRDCSISLSRVAIGASAAIVTGILLGLACSALPRFAKFATAVIELFRPIPPIAWIPLAILWFGIGEMPSYFIIFLGAFFPVFTNSFAGGEAISRVHRDVARSMLLNNRQFFRHVLLPTALPNIMAGIQVGLGVAWMAVIASEMVASQEGLGYLIQLNRLLLMSDRVIAGMILIGIIGFLMNRTSVWMGHLLTPWAQNHE